MWKSILKANPITVGSSKVGLEPLPDDDDCNRQLKAYADKLKNMKPKLKVEGVSFSKNLSIIENVRRYGLRIQVGQELVMEIMRHTHNPIPEEVACKALEMLNSGSSEKSIIIGEHLLVYRNKENHDISEYTYETKHSELHIHKHSESVVHLSHYVKIAGSKRDNNIWGVDTRWWK